MARVVLLQRDAVEWLGPMYLSAVLKARGHHCDVFVEPLERRDLVAAALQGQPDVVGFSCLTSDYPWALRTARAVKQASGALVALGGTHVTLNPEGAIQDEAVDVVCVGEGEGAVLDLADALDRGGDIAAIANLFVKSQGRITRNPLRRLEEDLDALPFPDRTLYAKYARMRRRGTRPLLTSRGCPYRCTYCHNTRKAALTRGKGKSVRGRGVEPVLAEVDHIRASGRVQQLHIVDDGFGIDREWLIAFLEALMRRPGRRLCLQANMRADAVSDELCAVFQRYGAKLLRLRIAVECGDERFRREVLGKNLSDEALLRAAGAFHRHGIPFATYNMVGLPGETLSQALQTLDLNLRLRPDVAFCFIYQPYPGTDLADYAVARGFLPSDALDACDDGSTSGMFYSRSPMRQPEIREVENVHHAFGLMVRFPALAPLMRRLVPRPAMTPFLKGASQAYTRWELLKRRLAQKY